ncbi:MAG: transglycosylase domain-containing protein [Prevotellaceae bacterium]|jgi:penicillin-binding protein 1A|nr:transglycosylase domain-containing protein [Prevotellaceae bacterium]
MKKSEISSAQKKSFFKWFWLFFAGIIGVVALIFLLISIGWIGYVPEFEELDNPKNKFATEIYSDDNKILGTFFAERENRMNCTYADLSPNLINALIATEDVRFYSHSGIDGKSVLRALVAIGSRGGGSTLSQQTAKLFFTSPARNIFQRVIQKMNEWVIAVKLEKIYTKEEIIALYFNKFDFLNNAVGIKTASQVYFNTTPDKLTVEQAALLVGMCKNPSLYNPASRRETTRERALNRRNTVLNQMTKYKYISQEECEALAAMPLELNYRPTDHKEGLAPYLREYLRVRMSAKKPKRSNYADWQQKDFGQYYLDSLAWETDPLYGFIEKYPKSDGTKYSLYSDGLKIYTTIDSRMQEYAENAVKQQLTDLQAQFVKEKKTQKNGIFPRNMKQEEIDKFVERAIKQSERYFAMKRNDSSEKEIFDAFNKEIEMKVFTWQGVKDTLMSPRDSLLYAKSFARIGFMSMQPSNGHVKAYVGGPNFGFFQYDMASVGRRQVGSTVKPFLYTLAMSNGWQPCDTLLNASYTFENVDGRGTNFTPRNGSKLRVGELVTLRWGLQNSNNWITARLMSNLSPYDLTKLMRNFGMSGKIDPVVSLCLGPCEVSVNEMVSAYTTFPNKGIKVKPIFVTRITDNKGNLIVEFNTETREVVNEKTACKMITMMQAVIDGGTGSRVKYRYGIPSTAQIGGKTGTTNDNADGWFIAYTPQLVSGVWVGWEDRQIHFTNMAEGQGANMALPVWALYMKKVFENSELPYSPTASFNLPAGFNPCE